MGGTAHALTVIDFQSLAQPGDGLSNQGFSYTEDGYTLTNIDQNEFVTFNTGESRYLGSTALINNTVNGTTILTKNDGAIFDLISIDLGELNEPFNSSTVTFVGTKADNSTISNIFSLDGVKGLQTFNFTDFTNLVSTTWLQVAPFHQFDNIVVSDNTTKSVPEPASLIGILGLGAFGITSVRKRKQQPAVKA
ncbi:PEP-CTERM sorting domain-containing protein [Nostoc sp. WHI]|nr:PEP-CTERM sorting domain-containing protein [Nostoc sp. WHI]